MPLIALAAARAAFAASALVEPFMGPEEGWKLYEGPGERFCLEPVFTGIKEAALERFGEAWLKDDLRPLLLPSRIDLPSSLPSESSIESRFRLCEADALESWGDVEAEAPVGGSWR
jgi:hypothetical protein